MTGRGAVESVAAKERREKEGMKRDGDKLKFSCLCLSFSLSPSLLFSFPLPRYPLMRTATTVCTSTARMRSIPRRLYQARPGSALSIALSTFSPFSFPSLPFPPSLLSLQLARILRCTRAPRCAHCSPRLCRVLAARRCAACGQEEHSHGQPGRLCQRLQPQADPQAAGEEQGRRYQGATLQRRMGGVRAGGKAERGGREGEKEREKGEKERSSQQCCPTGDGSLAFFPSLSLSLFFLAAGRPCRQPPRAGWTVGSARGQVRQKSTERRKGTMKKQARRGRDKRVLSRARPVTAWRLRRALETDGGVRAAHFKEAAAESKTAKQKRVFFSHPLSVPFFYFLSCLSLPLPFLCVCRTACAGADSLHTRGAHRPLPRPPLPPDAHASAGRCRPSPTSSSPFPALASLFFSPSFRRALRWRAPRSARARCHRSRSFSLVCASKARRLVLVPTCCCSCLPRCSRLLD